MVEKWLDRIDVPSWTRPASKSLGSDNASVEMLSTVVHHHAASVAFENSCMHYSLSQAVDLEPSKLYTRIVERRHGGVCLQSNRLLHLMLSALGFDCYLALSRVNNLVNISMALTDNSYPAEPKFRSINHVVVIVHIGGDRYLVDACFGPAGPSLWPIKLEQDKVCDDLHGRRSRLLWAPLTQRRDGSSHVWRLQMQVLPSSPWIDAYSFSEAECLPCDLVAISTLAMHNRRSFFVFRLFAFRTVLQDAHPAGWVLLWESELRWCVRGAKLSLKIVSEEDRLSILDHVFGMKFTSVERSAITGTVAALTGDSWNDVLAKIPRHLLARPGFDPQDAKL